jgi:hypothetical protein
VSSGAHATHGSFSPLKLGLQPLVAGLGAFLLGVRGAVFSIGSDFGRRGLLLSLGASVVFARLVDFMEVGATSS